MIRSRLFLLLLAALILTGCGFHLRNRIALPADVGPVRVASSGMYSELTTHLTRGLQAAGAELAPEPEAGLPAPPAATLRIVSERWGDLPIAVDQYGRSQEYSLRYAVIFSFKRADGSDLVPQQVVEMSRDYVSQPDNATGTTTEREVLARELRREMAASILRRIDGVVRTGQAAPAP